MTNFLKRRKKTLCKIPKDDKRKEAEHGKL